MQVILSYLVNIPCQLKELPNTRVESILSKERIKIRISPELFLIHMPWSYFWPPKLQKHRAPRPTTSKRRIGVNLDSIWIYRKMKKKNDQIGKPSMYSPTQSVGRKFDTFSTHSVDMEHLDDVKRFICAPLQLVLFTCSVVSFFSVFSIHSLAYWEAAVWLDWRTGWTADFEGIAGERVSYHVVLILIIWATFS